jgi:hypothetical protein
MPYTNVPHYYALMRAGYVLHSLECLECGVVGKCCSNVLRSPCAYGVVDKAVRTHVCEKHDRAHVRRSRCAIHYTQSRARSYTLMHACMPTYQIQTRVHALHVYLNSIYHTQMRPTTMHSCEQAMYCTYLSLWSVELWASAVAMCCAPFALMELFQRLCVRKTIQCTCVDHDARSITHNRVRGHIRSCIRACRHTKYIHTCMTCTYTYLHSDAQRNSIYHIQTCPTTIHSCEQAMYCTYLSLWSVELRASAAAMCCASFTLMELFSRL